MTVTAEPEVLPVEVTEPTPGLTEITPPDDDTFLEDVGEALMAMPAALLLGANTLVTSGATAFAVGGPVGLGAAGAVAGGGAAAAALLRRAHRAEQEKKDLAAGKTPNPKAPGQVKAARKAAKEARRMARVARKASGGPMGSSRSGGLASRAGGRSGGRSAGKTGGKSTGSSRHGKAGAHRTAKPATASKSGGVPTAKTATGKAAGKSRGALGRAAKSVGSSPAARPVRSAASKVAGSPMGKAVAARQAAGAGRSTAGRGAGGAGRGRGARRGLASAGGGLKSLGRRAAGGARRVAGGAKRAGAAGQVKLGKASHGLAGSRAGKAASGAGRRVASGARSVAGKAKRAGQVTRAGLAGARSAKGGTPRQIAAAARRAVARKQAQLAKQSGQPLTSGQKFRRKVMARALGTTAGVTTKGWRGARKTGAWGVWAVRAAHAKFHGRPIPTPPGRTPPPEPVDPNAHPPVGATVEEPSNTRPLTIRPTSEGGAAVLGNRLEELSNEMTTAATGYTPDGMLQWGRDMRSLEDVLGNVAQTIRALEAGAGNLPVNQAVIATLGSVAALQQSCSSAAAEIHATFRAVHAAELERLENPRTNEHMWDAKANQ